MRLRGLRVVLGMEKTVIEVIDVTLAFNSGAPPELERINLAIKEREIVTLVGPSGCGKSTLLRLIAGVLTPTFGEIKVFGKKEIPGWSGLSFVPQASLLFPWRTVLANVRLPLEIKGGLSEAEMNKKARAALNLANLTGEEEKFPHQLSGGMQQRAALARALVGDARLLLLDEPFAALDAMTRSQLHLELLRVQNGMGITVLLVTHNIFEAVFLSHRVLVMGEKPGCILGEVPVDIEFPRTLEILATPKFSSLVGKVQELLKTGWCPSNGK